MRISGWSSDVCSSDLDLGHEPQVRGDELRRRLGIAMLLKAFGEHIFLFGLQDREFLDLGEIAVEARLAAECGNRRGDVAAAGHDRVSLKPAEITRRVSARSEEHTSELQSLMRSSYAVFCLTKK